MPCGPCCIPGGICCMPGGPCCMPGGPATDCGTDIGGLTFGATCKLGGPVTAVTVVLGCDDGACCKLGGAG